jgi:hypothetical protein
MQLSQIATGLLQACQQVVTMLLFHQVATRLSLTTYWQIVGLQDDNKLLEKLNNLVASCQQAVDNLSTSWEQAVLTHPVDKLLEQHCYKSDNINKVVTKFTWCFHKQNYYILSPCKHTNNLLRLSQVVNSLFRTCWSQLGINKQYEHNLINGLLADLLQDVRFFRVFACSYATRKNLTSCGKSSTSCVRTACPKLSTSLEQAVTTCNNLVDIIRLVARLFQQVRCSHDITVLLQPCVVNLVTFLLYHDCIRLVRTTL